MLKLIKERLKFMNSFVTVSRAVIDELVDNIDTKHRWSNELYNFVLELNVVDPNTVVNGRLYWDASVGQVVRVKDILKGRYGEVKGFMVSNHKGPEYLTRTTNLKIASKHQVGKYLGGH